MEFDEVWTTVGGFGVFQLAFFILWSTVSFFSLELLWTNFIGYSMEHWCMIPELQSLPHTLQKDIAIPTDSKGNYDSCARFNLDYR